VDGVVGYRCLLFFCCIWGFLVLRICVWLGVECGWWCGVFCWLVLEGVGVALCECVRGF